MKATRQARAPALLAASCALGAAVLAEPLFLGGTAAIGAWLLARQYRFVAAVTTTVDGLEVEQSPAQAIVVADEAILVTLTASLPEPSPVAITVEAAPPVAMTGTDASARTVTIMPGERTASTTFTLACPVAGRHEFSAASITLEDSESLFEATHRIGPTPAVTVEPRTPRKIHIGEGGEPRAGPFGAHKTGRHGSGIEPAELRAYVPGDPAASIDWKATARLDEPHVLEYDVETDLQTALVVDHRASMGDGRPGQTKLEYARQVALAYLAALREDGMAVGLDAVGTEGLTVRERPATTNSQYATIRTRLHDLTVDADTDDGAGATEGETSTDVGHPRSPADARRAASTLAGEDSPFSAMLAPFYEHSQQYVTRIADDPMYGAVRSRQRSQGPLVTVILTDDTRRAEVREAVKLARRGTDRVIVFLLPSVLFEGGRLGDLDAAYDRYVETEEFRQALASLDRVSAFEVAPQDRIEAVLARNRGRPTP